MAAGRKSWARRLIALAVLGLYLLLVVAGIAPNPVPAIWDWLGRERPIADDLAWQERLGARPAEAAVAGDAVAVAAGGDGELRSRDSGAVIDQGTDDEWDAAWVLVAGDGGDAVVITGARWSRTYQIRDPRTGALTQEVDDAVAVWGFQDARADLHCDRNRACQLRFYRPPSATTPTWTADLPGERSTILGGNPELAGPRPPGSARIATAVAGPPPTPNLVGVPATRRGTEIVVIVDTRTGTVVHERELAGGERVLVTGGRLVSSVMERHNGVCVSEVTGYDPVTGDRVWGPYPYHLWSNEDFGCEQREPPLGSGAALAATGPDGRPVVIDAYDGRLLWEGERDERVEGLSERLLVVRAADESVRYGVRYGEGRDRLWERRADRDADLVVAGCGVVVADRQPNRVYVWDPDTGENRLGRSTSAEVLACAPDGVVLAEGRSLGFALFDDATDPPPLDSK